MPETPDEIATKQSQEPMDYRRGYKAGYAAGRRLVVDNSGQNVDNLTLLTPQDGRHFPAQQDHQLAELATQLRRIADVCELYAHTHHLG